MPYINSDSWETPNKDTTIIRYFTYDKFKSLIDKKALYFNEILNYKSSDPAEGLIPEANKKGIKGLYLNLSLGNEKIEAENDYEKKYKIVNFIQHFICVNCWNINYDENKLMWDKYTDDKFGIAIRTNIDSLINAFKYTREEIYIGRIKYVDHSTFINEQSNPFSFAFLKDKELYAWENELRLISFVCKECEAFNKFNNIKSVRDFFTINFDELKGVDHQFIDVDLNMLLGEVIVSPWADNKYVDYIRSYLNNNGIKTLVKESKFKLIK